MVYLEQKGREGSKFIFIYFFNLFHFLQFPRKIILLNGSIKPPSHSMWDQYICVSHVLWHENLMKPLHKITHPDQIWYKKILWYVWNGMRETHFVSSLQYLSFPPISRKKNILLNDSMKSLSHRMWDIYIYKSHILRDDSLVNQ